MGRIGESLRLIKNSLVKTCIVEESQKAGVRLGSRRIGCWRVSSWIGRVGKEEETGHLRLRMDTTYMPQEPLPMVP